MSTNGRRATVHNSRKGKNGTFKANHNDCSYLPEDERPSENYYWHCFMSSAPEMDFETAERTFYRQTFAKALEKQNEKHRKARNYKRVKTMDDWYTSSKTCPDETLYYLGSKDEKPVPKSVYKAIMFEQLAWEQKTFPNIRSLDMGLHCHEPGADHVHTRRVFFAHDEEGNRILSQEKALEEMGLEVTSHYPDDDPRSKKPRYANRKITYTDAVRAHLVEVCAKYGVEVFTEPREPSESGMDREQYIEHKAHKKADKIVENANEKAKQIEADAERRMKDRERRMRADLSEERNQLREQVRNEVRAEMNVEREILASERSSLSEDKRALEEAKKTIQEQQRALDSLVAGSIENYVKLKRPDVLREYNEYRMRYQKQRQNADLDYRSETSVDRGFSR